MSPDNVVKDGGTTVHQLLGEVCVIELGENPVCGPNVVLNNESVNSIAMFVDLVGIGEVVVPDKMLNMSHPYKLENLDGIEKIGEVKQCVDDHQNPAENDVTTVGVE